MLLRRGSARRARGAPALPLRVDVGRVADDERAAQRVLREVLRCTCAAAAREGEIATRQSGEMKASG